MHAALDLFAMWLQDRLPRAPAAFQAPGRPPACFGPLPALPPPPVAPGPWRAPSPLPAEGDRSMAVRVVPARGARRGTALLVPPWKLPDLRLLRGYVRLLARAGLEVWIVIPPRHFDRARPGTRSGEGFVSPDLGALQGALEQLVAELRVLAALARARGGEVGLVGLSLGALAAALASTCDGPLDFLALVAPPADLGAVFAETPIGRRYAALARRSGRPLPDAATVARLLAPLRPAARRPRARRILIAVGEDDRIASPGAARALARSWGVTPSVHPRGHLTLLFGCRALRRQLAGLAGGLA